MEIPPEEAVSVLMKVEWQTGRTGTITPVANIAPQTVAGVTVEKTTLHNIGELDRLQLSISDKVLITRRGDVIPKIEKSLGPATATDLQNRFHADGTKYVANFPEKSPITIPNNALHVRAILRWRGLLSARTRIVRAKTSRSILYWCRALELDGVGEKLVDQLLESSLVTNIADLYRLDKEDICSLDRMGEKSAENVLSELETRRK